MATAQVKHHDYHLVDPSPWPIVGSISAFIMALGAILWMHHMIGAAPIIFAVGFIGVGAVVYMTVFGRTRSERNVSEGT